MNRILEFFGLPVSSLDSKALEEVLNKQMCPFTQTRCLKTRKSQPDIAIGTCTVSYGTTCKDVVICPRRFLHKNQVFCDCIHLLSLHEPGNEFHIIPEISVPGGSIDFFLVSVLNGKVRDFVAIEFQTMDTTGTVWPERQRLLAEKNIKVEDTVVLSNKTFGINWKTTAKTTLVQLHHKIETIEHLGKHLVLVIQDHMLEYIMRKFCFDHLTSPGKIGDSMHVHSYSLNQSGVDFSFALKNRLSTDATGIATCLGLATEAKVELQTIVRELERKISDKSLMVIP
jgi:hypothetical protein